jgi:hypothetical protein
MTLTPRLRKVTLTAHVVASVGWLGAVVAYLILAITGLTGSDTQAVRAAYISMEVIGWTVLVPLALAALATGLVQSLGTEWGLFRYYWVLAKFLLTVGAVTVLLLHMPAVSRMAGVAAEVPLAGLDFREPRVQLVVHAVGGLLVLLTATSLSVFKPWGRTPYGRRVQERRKESHAGPVATPDTGVQSANAHAAEPPPRPAPHDRAGSNPAPTGRTRWGLYVLLGVVGLVVLFIVLHLIGGRAGH